MKRIHRPLPPHLTIYKSQLTSTFPISHRISGAILASMVLLSYFLCLKMGLICLTYFHFYQLFFYTFKFIPSSVDLTAFALFFHLYHGVRHLLHKMKNFWMEFEMHIYIIYLQNRFVALLLKKCCNHYCRGMGFCGTACSRNRPILIISRLPID